MSRVNKGLSMAELSRDAVYLSPLDRRCRWVPTPEPNAVLHFVYDTPQGRPAKGSMADGFTLSVANVRLLRRVA